MKFLNYKMALIVQVVRNFSPHSYLQLILLLVVLMSSNICVYKMFLCNRKGGVSSCCSGVKNMKQKHGFKKKNKMAKKGGNFCGIDLEIEIVINKII